MTASPHGDSLQDPSRRGPNEEDAPRESPTDGAAPHGDPLRDSNPNAAGPQGLAGGMGVSSERVAPTGTGADATDGQKPTHPVDVDDAEQPPEERPGNPEENPTGIEPAATLGKNPGHSHG